MNWKTLLEEPDLCAFIPAVSLHEWAHVDAHLYYVILENVQRHVAMYGLVMGSNKKRY